MDPQQAQFQAQAQAPQQFDPSYGQQGNFAAQPPQQYSTGPGGLGAPTPGSNFQGYGGTGYSAPPTPGMYGGGGGGVMPMDPNQVIPYTIPGMTAYNIPAYTPLDPSTIKPTEAGKAPYVDVDHFYGAQMHVAPPSTQKWTDAVTKLEVNQQTMENSYTYLPSGYTGPLTFKIKGLTCHLWDTSKKKKDVSPAAMQAAEQLKKMQEMERKIAGLPELVEEAPKAPAKTHPNKYKAIFNFETQNPEHQRAIGMLIAMGAAIVRCSLPYCNQMTGATGLDPTKPLMSGFLRLVVGVKQDKTTKQPIPGAPPTIFGKCAQTGQDELGVDKHPFKMPGMVDGMRVKADWNLIHDKQLTGDAFFHLRDQTLVQGGWTPRCELVEFIIRKKPIARLEEVADDADFAEDGEGAKEWASWNIAQPLPARALPVVPVEALPTTTHDGAGNVYGMVNSAPMGYPVGVPMGYPTQPQPQPGVPPLGGMMYQMHPQQAPQMDAGAASVANLFAPAPAPTPTPVPIQEPVNQFAPPPPSVLPEAPLPPLPTSVFAAMAAPS